MNNIYKMKYTTALLLASLNQINSYADNNM